MRFRLITIPNVITCLNLAAGCLSILSAAAGDFRAAFLWIVAAAVFDFLDGFAARLLRSYSDIGKELDSLADAVSFSAAPCFCAFYFCSGYAQAGYASYAVFVMAAFSILRLAKFNLDTRQGTGFIGLPTPANALLISSLVCVFFEQGVETPSVLPVLAYVLIGIGFLLSYLLISEIPMFSLKFSDLVWKGNQKRYLFLGMSAAALALLRLTAVPLIIAVYIGYSVVKFLVSGQVKA